MVDFFTDLPRPGRNTVRPTFFFNRPGVHVAAPSGHRKPPTGVAERPKHCANGTVGEIQDNVLPALRESDDRDDTRVCWLSRSK